jgi:ADP-heptose:LPS heptosyltransferase
MIPADRRIERILLIRRKGLGDALVTLPAVRRISEAWPAASIDLVMDRPFADFVGGLAPNVRTLAWSPAQRLVPWLLELRRARYDLVIDYLGSPRTALWTALCGASLRVGYDLPRRRWAYNIRVPRNATGGRPLRQFAGEAFLDPLRALGMAPAGWEPQPSHDAAGPLGDRYLEWVEAHPRDARPRAVVVLSASWPAKAWPASRGAELCDGLAEAGVQPVLAPGPGDDDLVAAVAAASGAVVVAPPTTLPELLELMRGADVFVGTDNGARHLAMAAGLPTVTLFGPTSPGGWNPDHPYHVAMAAGAPCAPCNLTRCPVAGHPCMEDLAPAAVVEAARRLIGTRVKSPSSGEEET